MRYFAQQYSEKLNKSEITIEPGFIDELKMDRFKGNIRELKNIIERSIILCADNRLSSNLLPEEIHSSEDNSAPHSLEAIEKQHILKILKEHKGNKTQTAKSLGIGIVTLYRKLKEYGLE